MLEKNIVGELGDFDDFKLCLHVGSLAKPPIHPCLALQNTNLFTLRISTGWLSI